MAATTTSTSTTRARRGSSSCPTTPTRPSTGWDVRPGARPTTTRSTGGTARAQPQPAAGRAWRAVMSDPAWRAQVRRRDRHDARRSGTSPSCKGGSTAWSQQIADAVASDPHTPVTPAQFQSAVAATRDVIAKRAEFLQSFVDCSEERHRRRQGRRRQALVRRLPRRQRGRAPGRGRDLRQRDRRRLQRRRRRRLLVAPRRRRGVRLLFFQVAVRASPCRRRRRGRPCR